MTISKELDQKIKQALSSKIKNPCEKCGHPEVNVFDRMVRLDAHVDNGVQIGGPSMQAIVVACSNCGKLDMFDPKILVPTEF
ncbi:hypothetical protein [Bacillus pumilus]|uniref:hypothetical protein n=1 Tax=Bacillus pumilus TaxID=1408 RepID=UPI0037EF5658|nr:hypothetical protein [Bacillus pumilus]